MPCSWSRPRSTTDTQVRPMVVLIITTQTAARLPIRTQTEIDTGRCCRRRHIHNLNYEESRNRRPLRLMVFRRSTSSYLFGSTATKYVHIRLERPLRYSSEIELHYFLRSRLAVANTCFQCTGKVIEDSWLREGSVVTQESRPFAPRYGHLNEPYFMEVGGRLPHVFPTL